MYQSDNVKILIAEDNPVNQQILEAMIKLKQWECTIVNNGQEAVEASKSVKYDLIFMDLNMPVLDGIQATREIRSYDKDIPIIAVTAYTDSCYREKSEEAGMNDFIPKPYTRKDIYEAVSRICLKAS